MNKNRRRLYWGIGILIPFLLLITDVSTHFENPTCWKMIIVELVAAVLIPLSEAETRKKQEEKRRTQLKLDYTEIVGNMAVLVGSGMPVKMAWNKISAHYSMERSKKERLGYELLATGSNEMADGETERNVYLNMADRAGTVEYRRLSRLLIRNLEKGSRALAPLLEQECEAAFIERKRLAMKLGEEASTKMLFPMMIMMCIVMAIVLLPAIGNFISV